MLICGGAMAGYCETGRPRMESAPASITRMPTTHAKMGLSMKNLATRAPRGTARVRFSRRSARRRLADAGRGHRLHLRTGPDLLQPLHDHLLARLHAGGDEPGVADRPVCDELAALDLAVGPDHERGRQALLVARHAHLRDEERRRVHALVEPRPHEHAGEELALRVREERAERDGARARADRHVRELERAGEAVLAPVLGHEPDLRAAAAGALHLPALEVAAEPHHLRGGLAEVHVDRVELL